MYKKIKNTSLEEKKLILRDYYRNAGIIEKSNELLLNFENKCKDTIKSLPNTIHDDITVLLNIIIKREK